MRGSFTSPFANSARGTGDGSRASRVLWRSHVLRTVFLCLLALIHLRAAMASGVTTDQARPQSESPQGWYGPEISTTVSLPLPAGSANRDEIGLGAGLSFTGKTSPIVSIGANIGYYYWPVSAGFKQQFNEFLRDQLFNTLVLGAGTWGLQVVQVGGQIRVGTPGGRGARPWLQVVPSVYRVDPNTSGYSGDAGFFTVVAAPLERTLHLGCSVGAGADLFNGPHSRMGLDANYHFVNSSSRYGEDLHVFMLGAHAIYGFAPK